MMPCNTCMERSRCDRGKAICKELIDYKQKRKENIQKNKERWNGRKIQ